MSDDSTTSGGRRQLPSWVVAVAIIVSGGATAWAAWQSGFRGPQVSWQTATQAVGRVWPGGGPSSPPATAPQPAMPMQATGATPGQAMGVTPGQATGATPPQVTGVMPPSAPAMAAGAGAFAGQSGDPNRGVPSQSGSMANDAARTVAGLPGVPRILFGATRPHPDRGACTNCHTVLKGDGRPTPNIASFSARPHEYRGVCSNCHQVVVGGNPVAGMQLTPQWSQQPGGLARQDMAAQAQLGSQSMAAPGGRRPPNEADWRGLEVRAADQGVVVTKSEGVAARAGMQPGDVIASINGEPVGTMNDFVSTTQNGRLGQGTVIARRSGGRMAFELRANTQQVPNVGPGATGRQMTGGFQTGLGR